MADITSLNKSISEMTDEEIQARIRELRTLRRTPVSSTTKAAVKRKAATPTLRGLTPEQLAQFLKLVGATTPQESTDADDGEEELD